VDAPARTAVCAERRACSCAGVAVDRAWALTIILPCPRVPAVADGGVGRRAATIALPFVRVQDRAVPWHLLGEQGRAGMRIRVIAAPKALCARLAP
jgi:hypothetical protein